MNRKLQFQLETEYENLATSQEKACVAPHCSWQHWGLYTHRYTRETWSRQWPAWCQIVPRKAWTEHDRHTPTIQRSIKQAPCNEVTGKRVQSMNSLLNLHKVHCSKWVSVRRYTRERERARHWREWVTVGKHRAQLHWLNSRQMVSIFMSANKSRELGKWIAFSSRAGAIDKLVQYWGRQGQLEISIWMLSGFGMAFIIGGTYSSTMAPWLKLAQCFEWMGKAI